MSQVKLWQFILKIFDYGKKLLSLNCRDFSYTWFFID